MLCSKEKKNATLFMRERHQPENTCIKTESARGRAKRETKQQREKEGVWGVAGEIGRKCFSARE